MTSLTSHPKCHPRQSYAGWSSARWTDDLITLAVIKSIRHVEPDTQQFSMHNQILEEPKFIFMFWPLFYSISGSAVQWSDVYIVPVQCIMEAAPLLEVDEEGVAPQGSSTGSGSSSGTGYYGHKNGEFLLNRHCTNVQRLQSSSLSPLVNIDLSLL